MLFNKKMFQLFSESTILFTHEGLCNSMKENKFFDYFDFPIF